MRAGDLDRQLQGARHQCSATNANADSVMLIADGGGLTWTCLGLFLATHNASPVLHFLHCHSRCYFQYTQGCICQISLGGSKFWLMKSTTVLMHRYIESRPPSLRFFIAAGGVRNFRGGFNPQPPDKYSPEYTCTQRAKRLSEGSPKSRLARSACDGVAKKSSSLKKLYCLAVGAHGCEQLARSRDAAVPWPILELTNS